MEISTLLNNPCAKEEASWEARKSFQLNKNEYTTYKTCGLQLNSAYRGMIALGAFTGKEERSQIDHLSFHLKASKKGQNKP